jgi:RNA polymerase sigma factor (sigma-70 family)
MRKSDSTRAKEIPQHRLLFHFRNGSPEAVAHVATLMRRVVRGGAYNVPESEHEDLVQEALLHAYRASTAPDFTLRSDFDSFICSIMYRRCVDWLRHRRVMNRAKPEVAHRARLPDESLEMKQTIELGRRVLEALSTTCRELLRLRMSEDLPYRVIANRLDTTEGAVRTRMYRCLAAAKRSFQALGGANDLAELTSGS